MGPGVKAEDVDTPLWAVGSQQGFGKSETVHLFLEGTVGASPD